MFAASTIAPQCGTATADHHCVVPQPDHQRQCGCGAQVPALTDQYLYQHVQGSDLTAAHYSHFKRMLTRQLSSHWALDPRCSTEYCSKTSQDALRRCVIADSAACNSAQRPNQGRLTLLLGLPGSGKSLLLKALSGQAKKDKRLRIEGQVLYNQDNINTLCVERSAAYVDQVDNHLGALTVRETLNFSARCRWVTKTRSGVWDYAIESQQHMPCCAQTCCSGSSSASKSWASPQTQPWLHSWRRRSLQRARTCAPWHVV